MARRILQRLDGMGKWGGYHTAFDHLARGFAGHERALAYEVGEALLAAGLLEQKPSVGQRHVYLSPKRSGDIRRLIDDGELPPGLRLPTRHPYGLGVDAQAAVRVHAQRAAALHQLLQLVAHQLAAPAVRHAQRGRRSRPGAASGSGRTARTGSRSAPRPRPVSIERWRTSAWASETSGASAGSRPGGSEGGGGGAAVAAARDRGEQRVGAAVERLRRQAADLLQAVLVARGAAGELHERLVGQHRAGRAVRRARLLLAPLGELAAPRRARSSLEAAQARQPLVRALRVALVAHVLERARLLARPFEPAALLEAALQLLAERQQQPRVVARRTRAAAA